MRAAGPQLREPLPPGTGRPLVLLVPFVREGPTVSTRAARCGAHSRRRAEQILARAPGRRSPRDVDHRSRESIHLLVSVGSMSGI